MQTKINKFLTLSFKAKGETEAEEKVYELKPANATQKLVEDRYLTIKKGTGEVQEIFYQSVNGSNDPFPKLELNTALFFIVGNGEEKNKIKLFDSKNENVITVDIRKNKTVLVFKNIPPNIPKVNLVIKSLLGIEIHSENLNVEAVNKIRTAYYSFDFTNFSFDVYTAELKGLNENFQQVFVIDKIGELAGKYGLVRILYDGDTLTYNSNNENFKFETKDIVI